MITTGPSPFTSKFLDLRTPRPEPEPPLPPPPEQSAWTPYRWEPPIGPDIAKIEGLAALPDPLNARALADRMLSRGEIDPYEHKLTVGAILESLPDRLKTIEDTDGEQSALEALTEWAQAGIIEDAAFKSEVEGIAARTVQREKQEQADLRAEEAKIEQEAIEFDREIDRRIAISVAADELYHQTIERLEKDGDL